MRSPSIPPSPLPPTTAQAASTLLTQAPLTDASILTSPQGILSRNRPAQRTLLGGLV